VLKQNDDDNDASAAAAAADDDDDDDDDATYCSSMYLTIFIWQINVSILTGDRDNNTWTTGACDDVML